MRAWSAHAEDATLNAAPAEVVADAESEKPPNAKGSGPRFGVGVEVSTEYSSNLFHTQDRYLDLLRSPNGPEERFYGMEGPQDLITTPRAEVGVRWRAHKLDTKLSLGAEYAVHARNSIANYLVLEAKATRDLTRRDSLTLELELTPRRFGKNYVYAELAGTDLFDRSDYLAWESVLDYDRKWAKRWRTTLEFGFKQIRYDDPFSNHDQNSYSGALNAEYDPWKRLTLALGVAAGMTLTPDGDELGNGVRIDRGHGDVEPSFGVELDLPLRFEVETFVAYRTRINTTTESADGAHFQRVDRRLTVGGSVTKRFGAFALVLETSFADSDSHRADPTKDPDQVGYQELIVGLGCKYAVHSKRLAETRPKARRPGGPASEALD